MIAKRIAVAGLLLVSILIVSGCTSQSENNNQQTSQTGESTTQPQTTPDTSTDTGSQATGQVASLKTCAELNGNTCGIADECGGDWLDASDTFSCCSQSCDSGTEGEVLEIETFDVTEENEDLGGLT